jgi:hypothetical protein
VSTSLTPLTAPAALLAGIPNPFGGLPNPFSALADAAGNVAGGVGTNLWTAAMLSIWNAGLFLFRLILNLMDSWLTPDLSTTGPGGSIYAYGFWLAATLMVILLIGQLGLAAFRRDAKLLARAAVGSVQFVLVWSSWIGYCIALIAACGGLTRAMLQALFGGAHLSVIDLWQDFSTDSVTSAATATVLGFLGIFLIISSLAHLLVFLVRSASLIVLVLTSQISAAGLVAEVGKSWFWKSVRWVHAAAFTPVLMVLVLGTGVKMTEGVATGLTDTTQQAIGSAVPGVVLICMSAVCPMALFKLLAFVDPGTATGAAMRQGLAANGGLAGLLSGKNGGGETGSSAASSTDEHGTSSGEDSAESATTSRFASAMKNAPGAVGSAIGSGLATGLDLASSVAAKAVAMSTDLNNQAGVGNHSHYPDFTGAGSGHRRTRSGSASNSGPNSGPSPSSGPDDPADGQNLATSPGGPHPDDTDHAPDDSPYDSPNHSPHAGPSGGPGSGMPKPPGGSAPSAGPPNGPGGGAGAGAGGPSSGSTGGAGAGGGEAAAVAV